MSEQDDVADDRPLDPWVRAALLAEGLDGGPTDAQRSRMAGKLAVAVGLSAAAFLDGGAGGAAAGAGAGAAGAAAGAAGTTLAGKTAALVIGAVIAGGGVGAAISELRPRSQPAPAPRATPKDANDANVVETPDAEPADAEPIDAVEIDAEVASPPVDAATHTRRDAAVHDAAPPMSADDLARERQLIDVARSALRSRDLQLAAKSLIEHGMRFPRGALVEEQRVLSIELAVAKGDLAGATTKATAFRRDYPRSVFRARVDELVPP